MDTKEHTAQGSPCSPAWDGGWIETVEDAEKREGRRLCGARTLDGTPCTLGPDHENGRCRYHGGFDLTGAQPGNRNAVIHGLYARGLQRCGEHCPQWETCPLRNLEAEASGAADLTGLPPHKRPPCPYETAQYQTAVTDLLASLPANADGHLRHLARQTALLQVITQRAAAALGVATLVETTHVRNGAQEMDTAKPAAILTAYHRLTAEHRRSMRLLLHALEVEYKTGVAGATDADLVRRTHDTQLTPEAQCQLFPITAEASQRADQLIARAETKLGGLEALHKKHLEDEADDIERSRAVGLSFEVILGRDVVDLSEITRTEHGFARPHNDAAYQHEVTRRRQDAFRAYQRAFRLDPGRRGPYVAHPENAVYLDRLDPKQRDALAPGNGESEGGNPAADGADDAFHTRFVKPLNL